MSQQRPKWKQVKHYFEQRGFIIYSKGGDKIISVSPNLSQRTKRPTVRIGHKYCNQPGDELLPCYCKAIERAFGVSVDDILNDR